MSWRTLRSRNKTKTDLNHFIADWTEPDLQHLPLPKGQVSAVQLPAVAHFPMQLTHIGEHPFCAQLCRLLNPIRPPCRQWGGPAFGTRVRSLTVRLLWGNRVLPVRAFVAPPKCLTEKPRGLFLTSYTGYEGEYIRYELGPGHPICPLVLMLLTITNWHHSFC